MSIHRSFVFFLTKEGLRTIELVARTLESKNAKKQRSEKAGKLDSQEAKSLEARGSEAMK